MPSSGKRKRHKGAACIHCRQMKMRCDASDMFPAACSRCQKAGKSCVIDPDFHRTAVRDRLNTLEKEVQDIRHAFHSPQTSKITPPIAGNAIQSDASPSDHIPDEHLNEDLPSKEELRLMLSTSLFFLDTPVLEATTISIDNACDILLEYYSRYHPLFPLLQDVGIVVQEAQSCPLLFWAIVGITRRDLAVGLSEPIRKLAGNVLFQNAIPSMPLIHALLILSYWPLPYGASSENPSWLYCGAAVHKALALGLHRPAFLADFVNWSLPNEKAILTRQKTWIACFIVNQTVSSMWGIPATVKADYTINNALREWPEQFPMILKHLLHISLISSSFTNTLGHFNGTPDGLFPEPDHVMHVFEADLDGLEAREWVNWDATVRVFYLWTKLRLYSFAMLFDSCSDGLPEAIRRDGEAYSASRGFTTANRTIDIACAIADGAIVQLRKSDNTEMALPQPLQTRPWTGFERAALVYAVMFLLKITRFSTFPTRSKLSDNTIRKALTALQADRTPLKHDMVSRVCDIIEFVCRLADRDVREDGAHTSSYQDPGVRNDRFGESSLLSRSIGRVRSRMSQNLAHDIMRSALSRFEGEEGRRKYPYSSKNSLNASAGTTGENKRGPTEMSLDEPSRTTPFDDHEDVDVADASMSLPVVDDGIEVEARFGPFVPGGGIGSNAFNSYASSLPPNDIFWTDWDLSFTDLYAQDWELHSLGTLER